jgi:simple sugar transport system substrate-binding protein
MKPSPDQLTEIKAKASEWAAERLADLSTVIVDTETTGLPSRDPDTEVCQLSITDNKGKVQIAKDAAADDKFLGGLNFYVKGVEGKIPGGK